MAKRGQSRSGGSSLDWVRKFISGTGLLALGVCLGIVLGSLWDGPRLVLMRLSQPIQSVEVRSDESDAVNENLEEFRDLQREGDRKRVVSRAPDVAQPKPAPKTEAKRPVISAPAAKDEPTVVIDAQKVIAELRDQRLAKKKLPPLKPVASAPPAAKIVKAPPSGKVVQVASYTESNAADALVKKLRAAGFDSYLSNTRPDGAYRYRVRVRPKGSATVQVLANNLKQRGYTTWVTAE